MNFARLFFKPYPKLARTFMFTHVSIMCTHPNTGSRVFSFATASLTLARAAQKLKTLGVACNVLLVKSKTNTKSHLAQNLKLIHVVMTTTYVQIIKC